MNTKSIDKEVLEITPGEWCITDEENTVSKYRIFTAQGGSNIGWFDPDEEEMEKELANSKAICKAINGTYGKGYNPDAMDELYKALQTLLISHYQLTGGIRPTEIEQVAETALKNSKTTN